MPWLMEMLSLRKENPSKSLAKGKISLPNGKAMFKAKASIKAKQLNKIQANAMKYA